MCERRRAEFDRNPLYSTRMILFQGITFYYLIFFPPGFAVFIFPHERRLSKQIDAVAQHVVWGLICCADVSNRRIQRKLFKAKDQVHSHLKQKDPTLLYFTNTASHICLPERIASDLVTDQQYRTPLQRAFNSDFECCTLKCFKERLSSDVTEEKRGDCECSCVLLLCPI